MNKRLCLMLLSSAFTLALAVSFSDAIAIDKAPKTELVVTKYEVYAPVINLNVDAEFCPVVFEIATASVIERPYFLPEYSILSRTLDVSRGPPELRV